MKFSFAANIVVTLILSSCVAVVKQPQVYRADGLPIWVGKTFTDPRGLWAGYNDEKGFYAWGEGHFDEQSMATSAADLDAKMRLAEYATGGTSAVVGGMRRVDRFIGNDGTVYVLLFISEKNAKKFRLHALP